MSIFDHVRNILIRTGKQPAESSLQSESDSVGLAGNSFLASLAQWSPTRPVLVALGALLIFTVAVAVLYEQTDHKPKPAPLDAASTADVPVPAASIAGTEPTQPQTADRPGSTSPTATSASPYPGPSAYYLPPTSAAPPYPSPIQLSSEPPSPTFTPTRATELVPTPTTRRAASPTAQQPTPSPSATSTPTQTPSPTQTPAPSATPTTAPTPGPVTVAINVPTLSTGAGYFYVLETLAGEISGSWKTEGNSTVEMYLIAGAPFGAGSGIADSPRGEILASSNVGTGSTSINPLPVPAGTYTVYFQSGAMDSAKSRSASITYVPAHPVTPTPNTVTRTVTPTRTPRPATATPIPSGTVTQTETPSPTPTPSETPYPGPVY